MKTARLRTIRELETLIEAGEDARQGFVTAAENLDDEELRQLFLMYAEQREEFAFELHAQTIVLGGDASDGGGVVASLHRGWLSLKSAISAHDPDAILGACFRGEEAALRV